jgi:hypothetical protein
LRPVAVVFDGSGSFRRRLRNNQPAQQEGGITRGQEGGARGGYTTTSFVLFCRATLTIHGIVLYCPAMVLSGVIVCRPAMGICGVVFSRTIMAIGGVVFFSLTAMGISGVIFRCSTWVVGIVIFHRATSLLVICRTTMAICSKHNNQTKEGYMAMICLMAAMDDGSVGGNNFKNSSAMTAMMPVQ